MNTTLPCPYAKKCGGCQLQNLTYEEQLHMKQAKLIRMLGRFGHVEDIIGMDDPTHYRNKIQAAFRSKSGKIVSGVYQSSSRHIIEVESCMLEDVCAAPILKTIRKMCVNFKIKPYDMISGQGFLRHVLIRKGFASGEIMVVLVTAKGEFKSARSFVNELLRRHPEITTVIWNVNASQTPLMLGTKNEILYGEGYITDTLCGLQFRISPRSFYQVNPVQTEVLYTKAKEYAALTGKEKVIDAYCGTGTIGLTLADSVAQVIGVEVNRDAVADAMANASLNGVTNAQFICADAGDFMVDMANRGESVDVVITDPPRAGCSRAFLQSLLKLSPTRVVYVSCNPETLARDLYTLTKGGYRVTKIQPVDLFPYTGHCECVVCIERRSS